MKKLLILVLLTGCQGSLDPDGKSTDGNSNNQTSNQTTSGPNNVTVTPDSGNTATPDAGTNNSTTPDVGMDPPDPVYLNPCDSGPLAAPIANCSPATPPTTGDNREDCVRRVNQFRWECQCLPPLQRWTEGEACADQQAAHDAQTNSPHNGFSSGICSPRGNAQNECPSWNSWDRVVSGCLQQMWDEGPGEPFSAHGHYINMSSNNYTMVACGEGGDWFVQNFQ